MEEPIAYGFMAYGFMDVGAREPKPLVSGRNVGPPMLREVPGWNPPMEKLMFPLTGGRPKRAGPIMFWACTDTGAIPKVKPPAISHFHTLPKLLGPTVRLAPVRNRFIENLLSAFQLRALRACPRRSSKRTKASAVPRTLVGISRGSRSEAKVVVEDELRLLSKLAGTILAAWEGFQPLFCAASRTQ